MTSNNERAREKFSDVTIRRFLLGHLSAHEQSAFERGLMVDDALDWRVRLVEVSLADDYARGRLTRKETQQLYEKFATTTERQGMLDVSEALNGRFASDVERTTIAENLKARFDLRQPAWRYAFAALVLLLVFATVWRRIKEPNIVERIMPKRAVAPKPTAPPAPQQANHPGNNSSPNHSQDYPALPLHAPFKLSVPLTLDNTADNPRVFETPKDEGAFITFELPVINPDTAVCRAELWSSKGELITAVDSLAPASNSRVYLDLPAKLLQSGEYQIRLSGESVPSASYFLRVR